MLDQRKWIFYLEWARLMVVMISPGVFFPNAMMTTLLLFLVSLLVYYFRPIEKKYLGWVYQQERK